MKDLTVGVYQAPDGGNSYMQFHTAYVHQECAARVSAGVTDITLADTISHWITTEAAPEVCCEECGGKVKEEPQ